MNRLSHGDLRGALRFLAACDAAGGLQTFALSVTSALPALIPAEVTVFALADLRAPTLQAVENPLVTSTADLETFMRVTQQSSNPLMDHFGRSGDTEARRMSDFVSQRQFHDHPLYIDFYRQMRLEFILGCFLNNSPTAFDGITLNRDRRDFDERDRSVLTLIRPHLIQGYRTALAVDRMRADLALALQAIEIPGFGLIILSGNGRMHLTSGGASRLLASYFDARRQATELPDALDRWVRHHSDVARDASRLPPLETPLVVERAGGRLVVRLVRVGRNTLLMLEEPDARPERQAGPPALSAQEAGVRLECLRNEVVNGGDSGLSGLASRMTAVLHEPTAPATDHLTPHEVRLLRLLAAGHSYKSAAAALGSSVNTVAFHMKHIYGKLQVHSKSHAVAKALRNGIVR
jgi:DNA-binding CsgD family transcriptional regulator